MKVFEILDPAKMFGGFNLMGIGDEKDGSVVDKVADMIKPGIKSNSEPAPKSAPAPVTNPKRSAPSGGKGSVNPNDVKSYLSSKGLDRNQVAGIMANIKAESSFRPGAIGDNGTSGGLFQHHKERFAAMKASAGKDWATNWKGQIDFALTEPAGRQYAGMKFSSPEAASKWFTINFERPANMVAKANSRSAGAASYA